ncbi:hypothetical protein PENTCL1PPCAC_27031, partial [Pristionchus entomophagus]
RTCIIYHWEQSLIGSSIQSLASRTTKGLPSEEACTEEVVSLSIGFSRSKDFKSIEWTATQADWTSAFPVTMQQRSREWQKHASVHEMEEEKTEEEGTEHLERETDRE